MKKQALVLILLAVVVVSCLALVGCAHVHKFGDWNVTRQPTCTDDGVAVGFCECGEQSTNIVTKTGHSYTSTVSEPSCTEQGYTTNTCRVCDYVGVDSYVDALGHDEIPHDGQSATCTEDGWSSYVTCSRCDYSTYQVLLTTGHNFEGNSCTKCSIENIVEGGSQVATANPGRFIYWTEFDGITTATHQNGTVTLDITNGGNWYSNQLFYKNPSLSVGLEYKLTGKIVSNVAGGITINGNVVKLIVGEQTFSITYTETSEPSFSLQMGTYASGVSLNLINLVISELEWEAVGGNPTTSATSKPTEEKSWTFVDAVIEDRAGVAWLKLQFTSTGYTQAEIESDIWYFDILTNDIILGGGWDMYFVGTKPEVTFISDSEYILAYNISSLPVNRGYIIHFGTQDQSNSVPTIEPNEAMDKTVFIGGASYRLFAVPGSDQASEFWGCLGFIITEE